MPHSPFEFPETTQLFNFLLEQIPDLIFFKDRNGLFICVNQAMLQRFGLSRPEEIVGKTDFDFLLPEDAQRTLKDEQWVLKTGIPMLGKVSRKVHLDGTPWWALTTKLPLRNAQGEIVGTCGISKDITQLKQTDDALARSNNQLEQALSELKVAQAQLIFAEKTVSVGRLAAGLAHEVRNPLNILSTGLEFFSSEPTVTCNPTLSMVLQEMRDAIARADHVISKLMEGSSNGDLSLECVDVNALLDDLMGEMTGPLARDGIKATLHLMDGACLVKADPKKIRQVIVSLVNNAREAMPEGGVLQITSRIDPMKLDEISRDAGTRGAQLFRSGDSVVTVQIEDTGPGIPSELLPRIFDSFFTTKEPGVKSGLGLGLTVCRAIVELHGGFLGISNRSDASGAIAILRLKSV